MPIYEFFCPDNRKIYSFFARSLAYAGLSPRCPDNARFRMERMISSFSFTGRAKEAPAAPSPEAPGEAQMEATIAEMEREFGKMNENNPDPRQVARMLRTMSRLSGDKIAEPMEEMMRRLEAGEALEKLEAEFGDAVDQFTDSEGGGEEGQEAMQQLKERLRAARRRPVRDPVLYEMSEYVELPKAPAVRRVVRKASAKR